MSLDGIAVPLYQATTELALRSPSADVTLRSTVAPLLATVMALNVGVVVSTRTVNGLLTVVTAGDSLSVALKVTVFRPSVRMMGMDQVTL